ncbi:hypothetical protein C8R43DRAFT_311939 [Mycena crocata]|nr:hypothetical protein C8R43DRAFT_311939 [Mycena crocata]
MQNGDIDVTQLGRGVSSKNKKFHKSAITPAKDRRDRRDITKQICAGCMTLTDTGGELLRCGRCKHTSYCSKECQRKDWPTHKPTCREADGLNMKKVSRALHGSTYINGQLQACFILAFDLLRNSRADRPFAARIDIGVEPTDVEQFMPVYNGRSGDQVQGMVQVNAFTPLPDSFIVPQAREIWRLTKENIGENGFGFCPVGLLVVSKSNALTNMLPIIIQPAMMQHVRDYPAIRKTHSLLGIVKFEPIRIDFFLEALNEHIRADDKNRTSLRTEMTPADIQVIRDAADGKVLVTKPADWAIGIPPPEIAATILKEKMERESECHLNIIHVGKRREALTRKEEN